MRLSGLSFAFVTGALVQIILGGVVNAADCCTVFDDAKSKVFDETKALEPPDPIAVSLPAPKPLEEGIEKLPDKETYADVFRMLKDENSCSSFFGGPNRAVQVFNQFARQLRSKSLGNPTVAISMSGTYTIFDDRLLGVSYRLFDEATINSSGPLFLRVPQPATARLHIGKFAVHTRQARSLALLHELGHLIRGADGKWLLPNDGNDVVLSERNTRTVEARCDKQLLALNN